LDVEYGMMVWHHLADVEMRGNWFREGETMEVVGMIAPELLIFIE